MKANLNHGQYLIGYAVYEFIPMLYENRFITAHMTRARLQGKRYQPQPVGSRCRVAKKVRFHVAELKEEEVELVQMNSKTCWVRLPDGNVVKRHLKKHNVTQ